MLFVLLTLVLVNFVGSAINYINEIDSGIITDKYISVWWHKGDVCYFTIEGEKHGRTVQHTFAVTEHEYDRYGIGDFYDKKGK